MEPLTQPDDHREWHQQFDPIPGMDAWAIDFWRPNWTGLLGHLEQMSWPFPDSLQVLLRDQDDVCFGLWMLHGGRLKEVPLPGTVRVTDDVAPLGSRLARTDEEGCPVT
ncbi:hypothetical protein ACQF36_37220 [Streptomyces sp. Marseille-Q5077]|uniref:hypothetical protein n=1 Tax=Streptomyces sp. Marseille-Q5077 TaxID=3418995 RepID=UPI003CFD4AE7